MVSSLLTVREFNIFLLADHNLLNLLITTWTLQRGLTFVWYLQKIFVDGKKNVVPEVWEVLDKIKAFSNKVAFLIAGLAEMQLHSTTAHNCILRSKSTTLSLQVHLLRACPKIGA